MVPAVHIWSGAVSNSWIDNANWSAGGSPIGDASATVIFPISAVQHSVNLNSPTPQPIAHLEFDGTGYVIQGAQSMVFTGDTIIASKNGLGTNSLAVPIDQEAAVIVNPGHPPLFLFDHIYDVAGGGTLDIEAKVTGAAVLNSVDKVGLGTLKLSRHSDYGGATDVHAGTLLMGGNAILPGGTRVNLDAGATLDLGFNNEAIGSLAGAGTVVLNGTLLTGADNSSTTFAGRFTNIAPLVKLGTGTFTLTAPLAYTGNILAINGGTVVLGVADVLSTNVQIVPGATLALQSHPQTLRSLNGSGSVLLGSASLTVGGFGAFGGVISGTGGLIKNSPATLILFGANTYTGPTQVTGGTLEVIGTLASAFVGVAPGAKLTGKGKVNAVAVVGTLSPGTTVAGTLHAATVTFLPVSSFNVRLNNPFSFDQLAAAGPVNLGGATLNVSLNFAPLPGQQFTIVQSIGPVFGTFKGLVNHQQFFLSGHKFEIIYTGNSVVLKCIF
jgi:autotransporter-associated beta strand protein